MTDATTEDIDVAGLVAIVDGRRAEGLSVAAACRAAGVSTSTYYRRRRLADRASQSIVASAREAEAIGAIALVSQQVSPSWPFAAATPHAPLFWDQAFADEMTDSFVRREFGAVLGKARPLRPMASMVIATNPQLAHFLRRARKTWLGLTAGPLGLMVAPLAAILLIALLVVTAGWMVSVAADPAAWLSHPAATEVATAAAPLSR